MALTDKTSRLKTQANELTKQHIVYDGSGRPTDVYTAPANAVNNTPCTHTFYQYSVVPGQTQLATGMREENDVWQAAFDF